MGKHEETTTRAEQIMIRPYKQTQKRKTRKYAKSAIGEKEKSICGRCRELYYRQKKQNEQFGTLKKGKKYAKYAEEGQAEITDKYKKWKDWCVIDGDNIGDRESEVIYKNRNMEH